MENGDGMSKKTVYLEDGRYLIYYEFTEVTGTEEAVVDPSQETAGKGD